MTTTAYNIAWCRALDRPAELTDSDLDVLRPYVDPPLLDSLRTRRAEARKANPKSPLTEELATATSRVLVDALRPVLARLSRLESDFDELRGVSDALQARVAVLESKS